MLTFICPRTGRDAEFVRWDERSDGSQPREVRRDGENPTVRDVVLKREAERAEFASPARRMDHLVTKTNLAKATGSIPLGKLLARP
jgi:hypothetical protein